MINQPRNDLLSYKMELYKRMYDEEVTRREAQSNRIQYAITITLALFGANAFLFIEWAKRFKKDINSINVYSTVLIIAIAVLAIIIIVHLIQAMTNYKATNIDDSVLMNLVETNFDPIYNELSDEILITGIKNKLANEYYETAKGLRIETNRHIDKLMKGYFWIVADVVISIVELVLIYLY